MLKISGKSYSFYDDSIISIEADPLTEDVSIEHERDMTTVTVGGMWIIVEYGTLKYEII
ncbi:hypothetical protein [Bacillus phage vB_BanS-Thrax4]|nr:hypothetical protein [Bacillus phage vB_BanS-Thrax4]